MQNKIKTAIVTGSSGLIGSQTVKRLIAEGYYVVGIDNDMRAYFFGEEASTKESENKMKSDYGRNFNPLSVDIRDYVTLETIFKGLILDNSERAISDKTTFEKSNEVYDIQMIVHTAAQPSHDWAAKEPLTDFSVNAIGTMNLLELTRLYCPTATFIFTSTNKVYGDTPNHSPYLQERETRYECVDDIGNLASIDEFMSIDHTKHSIFGASKVAADIMVQEYGRYFGINTVVFRGGCLTGPNHQGAELHGFLAYLIKCIVNNTHYNIFGYKGKQVRDNIHSDDLVSMFLEYHKSPNPGAVYNAGGGRENSTSILEAIASANSILKEINPNHIDWDDYTILEDNRIGDHIWYISDLTKFKTDYPEWPGITISLQETIKQMIEFEMNKK